MWTLPGRSSRLATGADRPACGLRPEAHLLHLLLHGVDRGGRQDPLVLDGHRLKLWSHDALHLRLQDWGGGRFFLCAVGGGRPDTSPLTNP